MPAAKPAPNKKVEIQLIDQNGIVFTALINAKNWRKAEANATEFESWAGAVSGKLGQPTADGFEIVDAGVQIFEKKAKEPKPEATLVDADSVPIL
ncbi:MAG TPA: hypothetical protein V6D16_08780 [Candidatus Obscuribacterales bacterium]